MDAAAPSSDPSSPPPSSIGEQSLLSDSDSPDILEGNPSPLSDSDGGSSMVNATSTELAGADPESCMHAAAHSQPVRQPGLVEAEMVSPTSPTHALATAAAAKRASTKQISWKVRASNFKSHH
jgi:hypothetical protein